MIYAALLLIVAALASATDATDECASSLAIEDVERYQRDGYVIIRNLFSAAEADVLRKAIETDPMVASNDMPMVDAAGARSKLTLWNSAGNDTFGYFARGRRWVNAARRLIGSPIYHFHTKVMLKEPRVGGTWEWHQDFGYWYQVGCLEPDKMLSAILAVDNHTIENGCMQLLSGSHRLGRLAHGVTGCVEIDQCVGCTRQFFTKSFLGDDAAVLARSSGEERAPPRYRAGVASMAWRTTRRFSTNAP
jgi:hypothetical protein